MSRPKQQQQQQYALPDRAPANHATGYSSSYQSSFRTPSRIPRPSIRSPASNASYASIKSSSSTASTAPLSAHTSRKRARPMSPTVDPPSYAISPFDAPGGWSHINAANGVGSPPPMSNTSYLLKGGMDTPSIAAEKRYQDAGEMDFEYDGRMRRGYAYRKEGYESPENSWIGGERNGRGRQFTNSTIDEAKENNEQTTWGGFVLGALGSVVAGAFAFCRKAAFQGFHAGGGQGYNLNANSDPFANETMWEDEQEQDHESTLQHRLTSNLARSYDRLPTPVPGEYPQDSPPPPEDRPPTISAPQPDLDRPPAKRRQTDSGGWIVVDRSDARSRTSSPRLSTPVPNRISHQRVRSGSSKRPILPATRSRQRLSTSTGSPAQLGSSTQQMKTSPSEKTKISPPSVEAKKFAAKKRKEEKANEERYDRLNDQLKAMIRQGKEALGSKVEIVDDEEMW